MSSTMLSHSSALDLEQYVGGQLAAAEAAVIQTHLERCEECQLRLAEIALHTQWRGAEGRAEPRVAVDFPARLKLLDPVTSVGPPHDVRVIEISRTGLKVHTSRLLLPKTLVQVRFNGKAVLGEVRYCMKVESEYHAGIKQVPDFPSD
ncbi:MAG: PilZ domain-containing protein [Bryobacteraceae bacterium]